MATSFLREFGIREEAVIKKVKVEINNEQSINSEINVRMPKISGTLATLTDVNNVIDSDFRILDNVDNTKRIGFQVDQLTTGTTRTFTAPDNNGTLFLVSDLASVDDSLLRIVDDVDSTKQAAFQCSGISPSTTRTFTFPDENGTLVTLTTLANIPDDSFGIINSVDNTKRGVLSALGISTGTTRTAFLPDADGTLALTSQLYNQGEDNNSIAWRLRQTASSSINLTIDLAPLTVSRTLTVKDESGTIALTSDIPTLEENSFTPTLLAGGGFNGFTNFTGNYIRVGNTVQITMRANSTGTTTLSNTTTLGNLPYTIGAGPVTGGGGINGGSGVGVFTVSAASGTQVSFTWRISATSISTHIMYWTIMYQI